ncbi:MAG: ImmA/IrrE family metallo-endopeptidase [Angustibacter sp.]
MLHDQSARTLGGRFVTLRHIEGLTQGVLAESLGITQSFLSQLERGIRPTPEAVIYRACQHYGLPQSFFTVSITNTGPITFSKTSKAGMRAENRVTALYGEAARLYRITAERSNYRTVDFPDETEFDKDPELTAQALRQQARISADAPVLNVTRALERLGVGVIDNLQGVASGSEHAGVSQPSMLNTRPLVAIAPGLEGAKRRFTLAHELGHLALDRNLSRKICHIRTVEENRANRFAGAFLLPEPVARHHISETLNLSGYLRIKANYGLSVLALLNRGRDLSLISDLRYRSLCIQYSSQGWRNNEPVPVASEEPQLLRQALRVAFGPRFLTVAAQDVGLPPAWIASWAQVPETAASGRSTVVDFRAARARSKKSTGLGTCSSPA